MSIQTRRREPPIESQPCLSRGTSRPENRRFTEHSSSWRANSGRQNNNSKRKSTLSKDRKSTRLNSSHLVISYAVFCLKNKYLSRPKRSLVAPSARYHTVTIQVPYVCPTPPSLTCPPQSDPLL